MKKTFSMSMFMNEADLYKAKAEYYEEENRKLVESLKDIVSADKNNSGYEPSVSVFGMAISEAKELLRGG